MQARIDAKLDRRTAQVARWKAELRAREEKLVGEALDRMVRAHLDAELRRASILDTHDLPDIGARTIVTLLDAGVRTSADFTAVVFGRDRTDGSRVATFVRPNGLHLRVPGVGEAQATALADWRAAVERRARSSAPTALPPQRLAQVRAGTVARLARRIDRSERAQDWARWDMDRLRGRAADERRSITAERRRHRTESRRERAGLVQRQKQLAGAEAEWLRVSGELTAAKAESRRALGVRTYLRFVVTGR
ncbi:hypothetical protein [Streptomyces sp. NPDC088789]|uniref:hypothetical protein n=1 Tax=Streptomyces sp. NPDC088789 TaxID=3365899 RepID=UPI003813283A